MAAQNLILIARLQALMSKKAPFQLQDLQEVKRMLLSIKPGSAQVKHVLTILRQNNEMILAATTSDTSSTTTPERNFIKGTSEEMWCLIDPTQSELAKRVKLYTSEELATEAMKETNKLRNQFKQVKMASLLEYTQRQCYVPPKDVAKSVWQQAMSRSKGQLAKYISDRAPAKGTYLVYSKYNTTMFDTLQEAVDKCEDLTQACPGDEIFVTQVKYGDKPKFIMDDETHSSIIFTITNYTGEIEAKPFDERPLITEGQVLGEMCHRDFLLTEYNKRQCMAASKLLPNEWREFVKACSVRMETESFPSTCEYVVFTDTCVLPFADLNAVINACINSIREGSKCVWFLGNPSFNIA